MKPKKTTCSTCGQTYDPTIYNDCPNPACVKLREEEDYYYSDDRGEEDNTSARGMIWRGR